MTKKKNNKYAEAERDYYKLHTDAVDRLANADKATASKVTDEEINKYKSSKLSMIPVWIKALFIKFWFAGACCFFFYWGLAAYIPNWLDTMVVLGLGLGIVTDILTNNVLRFISTEDKEYYPYMMFSSSKYWTFFANILYAGILLAVTIMIYSLIKIGVEPILFGIIYTAVDMLLIKLKDKGLELFRRK